MGSRRTRIYVGRVAQRTRERDLEDVFRRYGRIRYSELKMGYAFIDYEDERDAEDAVRALDGHDLDGSRLIVEWSRGPRSSARAPNRPPQRSEFRAQVDNMPRDMSWQDLKDFFREAGEVVFADVFRDRSGSTKGIVEFRGRDDLRYAIRRLDGADVRGSKIRVKEDRPRSRSRSRSPRRSPDRRSRRDSSPQRKRDRSRDRDRSPRKSSRDERKRRRTPSPAPASSNDTEKKRSPSPEADREQKESRAEHSPSPKRSPKRSRHSGSRSPSPSRSPEDTGKHNEGGEDKDEPEQRESNGREDDRSKDDDDRSD